MKAHQMKIQERQGGGIHAIDSELLLRKLMEKRRGDSLTSNSYYSSSNSSKSQSLTKLNAEEPLAPGGDMMNAQLLAGNGSPNSGSRPSEPSPPTTNEPPSVEWTFLPPESSWMDGQWVSRQIPDPKLSVLLSNFNIYEIQNV
jgi:hypothetical protein